MNGFSIRAWCEYTCRPGCPDNAPGGRARCAGWTDANFDFGSEASVDRLVRHDTTGTYGKSPAGAGHPDYEPAE